MQKCESLCHTAYLFCLMHTIPCRQQGMHFNLHVIVFVIVFVIYILRNLVVRVLCNQCYQHFDVLNYSSCTVHSIKLSIFIMLVPFILFAQVSLYMAIPKHNRPILVIWFFQVSLYIIWPSQSMIDPFQFYNHENSEEFCSVKLIHFYSISCICLIDVIFMLWFNLFPIVSCLTYPFLILTNVLISQRAHIWQSSKTAYTRDVMQSTVPYVNGL